MTTTTETLPTPYAMRVETARSVAADVERYVERARHEGREPSAELLALCERRWDELAQVILAGPGAPGDTCDDCEAPDATDYGHTVLCDDCAEGYDLAGPSDHRDRMHERRQMGLSQ